MRNIFILYIPIGNYEAQVHYQDTIKNKVLPERIFKYIDSNLKNKLTNIFGNKLITVWGSRDSEANRAKFSKMKSGDDILIVEGETIKLLGKIAATTINHDLSSELWKNLKGDTIEGWDLIYFIANPLEVELSFNEFKKLFNYEPAWSLRGLTSISENKIKEFYTRYDDLYSILQKIKNGERIEQKVPDIAISTDEKVAVQQEDVDRILDSSELSDHVRMQWILIRLGLKSGSKVWVPKSDQQKISKEYKFSNFETEFTAGIDTPAKYVENIDVVWKEEYRIDSAFEIENSTSIYSGLLRFADLKIVAPNSNYPLFVVAPESKKNRLLEQVKRPTFKRMDFDKKVRYLSYETVNEIDKFFETSDSGLNPEILVARSEMIS